jgi:putative peptidoglycan lipid II flippase
MGRAALVVSAGILLSRILGLLREVALADLIGANAAGDAYRVAFIIPDFLNYLLAGGYMAITFIPILSRYFADDDERGAWEAFVAVARPVGLAMAVLAAIGMLVAGPVIEAVTALEPEEVEEAARLTRIILPAQVFFVVGTLLMAVQYARERFLIPTLAPIVYNLMIILGGLLLTDQSDPSAEGFAWGVLAGAIIGNFLIQAYGAYRVGLRLPAGVPLANPVVREYLLLALPLMLGQSLVLLDESFARVFGTQLGEGPTSQLGFARQTMLVPIGVVAQAAGVAAYPYLARLAEEGKLHELSTTLARAIRYVIVAGMVAAAGLMALSIPTIRALFERGEFQPADTTAAAAALVFYALGIPFWGVQQLLARGFYARRQMWVPVVVGTGATVLAIPIYIILKELMDVRGIALASTVSIAAYTIVLGVIWLDRTGTHVLAGVARTAGRALVPAIIAGGAAWFTAYALQDVAGGFAGALLQVLAGGVAAAGSFLLLAAWMGTPRPVSDE